MKKEIDDVNDFLYDDEEEYGNESKYLTFRLSSEQYGINIERIVGITELQKITEVPDMPIYVKGVVNLRGKVIPVIDMRKRFNIEEKEYDDRTCMIEIDFEHSSIGFIVDTVEEVLEIPDEQIDPPPRFRNLSVKNQYIKGMGKINDSVRILLDIDNVLNEEEIETLKEETITN